MGFLPKKAVRVIYPGNYRVLWVNYPEIAKRPTGLGSPGLTNVTETAPWLPPAYVLTPTAPYAARTRQFDAGLDGPGLGAAPGGDLKADPTDGCFTGF